MSKTEMTSEDVRVLADLGYVALSRGLDQHAMAIFQGVKTARPQGEAGAIGIALVHLLRGDMDTAIKLLRGAGPGDAARTFLGIALARHGDVDEAKKLLTNVAATTKGTPHGNLAAETLASLGSGKP
jgi:hypothetical protein